MGRCWPRVALLVCVADLALPGHAQAVCNTGCPDSVDFPVVTFTSLASTLNVDVSSITSVRFIAAAGLGALINVTTDSSYDAGAASCPFFRVVPGMERPPPEHSSHGWSFGTPSISNGVVSMPLTFSCESYLTGGAGGRSVPMLALGAMAAASFRSSASLAAACALPGVDGQPSCVEGCQPFAHVELVGAHPNVTVGESSATFNCAEEGCGVDSSCSTTAPENKCKQGWVMGRPFSSEDGHVISSIIQSKGSGWADDLGMAAGELNVTKAQQWRLSGLAEHSSVAAFARVALELMAVGAPAELVADAHQAAIDEVRHASRAFALAQLFGGDEAAPSAFPLKPDLHINSNLSEVVKKTFEEGCMAEMMSLANAKEQLLLGGLLAEEQTALQLVFQDEAGHAALAWRTVRWALQQDRDASLQRMMQVVLGQTVSQKSVTNALHHEVMRRSTIPWLRRLMKTGTFKGIMADLEAENNTAAPAAAATARAVAELLELRYSDVAV